VKDLADETLHVVRSGLSDRYAIVREIGRGGMGIVFLAVEKRHQRQVAIKVLRPDLSGAVGAARFLREIAVVARLDHPHIVPLYDSGELQQLPYYVMPYVEGESLRSLVLRETQLPLEEVVAIVRQVGAALDYAHGRGIVHRDIKSQNILVANGQALVADFGVALALAAAGQEKLTATGIAIGSPEYMSPEQAAGTDRLDHRTDIYSLGCVVYEMLAGEPPFRGRSPQAVMARHVTDPVPDLRTIRPTIPAAMESAVKRALAKIPADRYRTATAFADALELSLTRPDSMSGTPPRARRRRWVTSFAAAGLIMLAAGSVWLGLRPHLQTPPPRAPGTVAVIPVQWSGAPDSSTLTPRELVQLVSTRLSGSRVLQPIDPALVLRSWERRGANATGLTEREGLRMGAELGADQVLLAAVHGTPGRLSISGAALRGTDGKALHRTVTISGPADSVVSLLDRFAIALLMHRIGQGWRRQEDQSTHSLEAVRLYVSGIAQYRRGRFVAATEDFQQAVRLDPGFVVGRMWLGMAYRVGDNVESELRTLDETWLARDALAREDSLFLMALVGERYPAQTPAVQQLETWEWVADSLPDQWEGTYELGDMLFHWGAALGKELPLQRAQAAFRQVLNADSAFAPALEHLIDLAAMERDTAGARRLGELYFRHNRDADNRDYVRWRLAVALGDSSAHREIIGGLDGMARHNLEKIVAVAQLDGLVPEDARAAVTVLQRRSRNEADLWWTGLMARELALNRGRPSDLPRTTAAGGFALPVNDLYRVIEALHWSGDSSSAAHILNQWIEELDRTLPRRAVPDDPLFMKMCAVGLWRAARGRPEEVGGWLERLRAASDAQSRRTTAYLPVCFATIAARHAAARGSAHAPRALAHLDSLLASGPMTNPYVQLAARHALADLREGRGELAAALAATRRRHYFLSFGVTGLSDLLLRESGLAVRTGDTTGAIVALEKFLALRAEAEGPYLAHRERIQLKHDQLVRAFHQTVR
jgi:serine/threonine-protein kinase